MTATTTHIAGLRVFYRGRAIQRCAVCGEKLHDMKCSSQGEADRLGTYDPGTLVRDGLVIGLMVAGQIVPSAFLPDDFCIELVEA